MMCMRDLGSMLRFLRGLGWVVAAHSDNLLFGKARTSWLFTHPNGTWVKGEDESDELAVASCIERLGHAA